MAKFETYTVVVEINWDANRLETFYPIAKSEKKAKEDALKSAEKKHKTKLLKIISCSNK